MKMLLLDWELKETKFLIQNLSPKYQVSHPFSVLKPRLTLVMQAISRIGST